MKEYLFRGLRPDNGEWVFGGICDYGGGIEILEVSHYAGSMYEPPSTDVYETEVLDESVGQFTGVEDKNGVKVFEGDIIKHHIRFTDNTEKEALGVVKFGSYESKSGSKEVGFYIEWKDSLYSACCRNDIRYWLEDGGEEPAVVVGNVFDNADLIKEVEEQK